MVGCFSTVLPVLGAVFLAYQLFAEANTGMIDTTTQPMDISTPDDGAVYDPDFELSWEQWLEWSECSKPCAGGEQVRLKLCNITKDENITCPEELWSDDGWVLSYEIEVGVCNSHECAQNGTWTEWGGWSNCSADCGDGVQERRRLCEGVIGDGEQCLGRNVEFMMCNYQECNIIRKRIKKIVLDPNPYKESDRRPSAQTIGGTYVILVVGLLILIVGLDLATIKRHCMYMINSFRRKSERKSKKKTKTNKEREESALMLENSFDSPTAAVV